MDNVINRNQLWRVDLIHRNGYHAPYRLIEVQPNPNVSDYKKAHSMVLELKLRLLDFPEKWSFRLTKLDMFKIGEKWIKRELL